MSTRTDLDMTTSGQWAKAGRKHYRHVSGATVRYMHNEWVWRTDDGGNFPTLWAARCHVEATA